jgi:hypothetical protein
MKKYYKPEVVITSYEAEKIMLVSGATQGVQGTVTSVNFSELGLRS